MNKDGHVVWDVFMGTNSSTVAIFLRECCSTMVECYFKQVIFIMDSCLLALFGEEGLTTLQLKMQLLSFFLILNSNSLRKNL